MNKYLNCEEILDRWKIKKLELFECVQKGLQPYSADTGIPIPCHHTLQGRLRSIERQLNVVKKYQKSPANLTREEEDWLLRYGAPPKTIIDECLKEQKLIKSKMKKMNFSGNDTEGSWKFFHLLSTEKNTKWVIDDLFKKAIFLENEIKEFLGTAKSNNLTELSAERKDPSIGIPDLDKITDLIKKASPGIELLYDAVRKIPNKENQYKIKNSVLKKYDDNEDLFEIIEKQDLLFDEIYILTMSKEKRDFVGKLFQQVIKRRGLKNMGISKIYKIFKSSKL